MPYRINFWLAGTPEGFASILAQVETIFEKASKTAETFGAGDDHFRVGMLYIFCAGVLLVGNYIAFKLLIGAYSTNLKEAKAEIAELRKENREIRENADRKIDELREAYDKKNDAYWGAASVGIQEMAESRKQLERIGVLEFTKIHQQLPRPEPSQSVPTKTSFLPSPPRRVPSKHSPPRSNDAE